MGKNLKNCRNNFFSLIATISKHFECNYNEKINVFQQKMICSSPDNGTDRSNAAVDDIIELYRMNSF